MHGPVTYTDIYDEITHHFRFINKNIASTFMQGQLTLTRVRK